MHWKEWKPYPSELQEEMVRAENWYEEEEIEAALGKQWKIMTGIGDAYGYRINEAISFIHVCE